MIWCFTRFGRSEALRSENGFPDVFEIGREMEVYNPFLEIGTRVILFVHYATDQRANRFRVGHAVDFEVGVSR